ncbi:hypothetical protein RJ55_03249 [Drechmeria coniospora]|nr:hypothetical protein RJ55_03249 [Drechmeria coniospora]
MSAFTALNGGSPRTAAPPQPVEPAGRKTVPHERPQGKVTVESRDLPELSRHRTESLQKPERTASEPNYADVDGSHKRKRSSSDDANSPSPAREQAPTGKGRPSPPREHRHAGHGRGEGEAVRLSRRGHDEHGVPGKRPTSTTNSTAHGRADDHANDTLQRASSQLDHSDYSQTSPDGEDRSMSVYSPFPGDHRQDLMLQHDPKKRKRNFSNRTKTGCLTCRKRKKKCDEQKPECSNCIRGGFACAGYPVQRGGTGWHKADKQPATIPLESKDPSYVPPGAYGMPQQAAYAPQPAKREPLPPYRGQALRIDPPQGRSLALSDDDRPTASTLTGASVTSPGMKISAAPYTPANAFPTPVSANTQPPPFAERMAKDYHHVPSLHDMARSEGETARAGNQLPQINILHPTRASSPTSRPQQPASNAQVAAQLALSHPQFPQRRTQKEEMLCGRHYYPFDKELCLERERCAVACWRFNNLTNPPSHGVSPEERARLFLEILQPRDPVRISPSEASPVTNVGRVGRHVAVETPFTCDYGYNISIGNHVAIGRNCTINDVCEVKVGDNCVIGHNVSIFTASLPIDPKKRQGGQGPQMGKGITIEQDCWIGGGAIILPGRIIGKGSTVGAGSIVTKDVPPFTVVAGNPARVLRGVGVAP